MADIVDLGNDRAEEILQDALNNRPRTALPRRGTCHNCDAAVDSGHLFCDTDCRDDWEMRNKIKSHVFPNGGPDSDNV